MDTQSAEGFLKSLKASNDVELAISAYANEKLYIPSKGQFLATWAFNTLLKNNNIVSDSRYWTLLESILLDDSSSSPLWLPTLVYKTPVVPILTSILRNFALENGKGLSKEMLGPCHRVLKMVLPMAYPKTRLDTVLDCFWASLDALSGNPPICNITELVDLGVDGLRAAFTKATNKTKIYGSFVEGHFTSFACAILNTGGHFDTRELIWAAARDIICSFDATRAISQQIDDSNQGLFGTLLQTCESTPEVLRLCPRLFVDQITAARAHRSALSQINVEIDPWQHYTSFAFIFEKIDTAEGALARLEMLTEVEKHVGSGIREQRWVNILSSTAQQCLQKLRLQETKNSARLQSSLTGSLVILGRMNYDLIASHIPEILEILAHLPSENISGRELYEVILSYHSKTRNMDNFSKELFGVVLELPAKDESLPSTIDKGLIFDIMNSCLLGTTTGSVLSLALKQYVTPGQILRIVSMAVSCLQETWRPLKDIFDTHPPTIISAQPNTCSSRLALVFRLASFVLPALPVAPTLQRELTGWRNTLCEEVAMPSLRLALDESSVNKNNWAFQIVGSAILRFISSLEGTPLSFKCSKTLDLAGATSREDLLLHRMGLLGDLKLELTRVLLRTSSPEDISIVIQNTLGYLRLTKSEVWNGRATAMTTGTLSTGLTLLLTDRWLTTLESYATEDQLKQFARLIILPYDNGHLHTGQISILPSVLAQRTLRNGLFWELSRIQGALLSAIIDGTERAELVGSGFPPGQTLPPEPSPWPTTIEELGRYFHILLFFPFEAFKGGNAAILARRALLTDQAASQSSDSLSFSTLATRTSCRLFASRCLQDAKSSFADYIGDERAIQFLTVAEPGFRSYPELEASFFQATYAILDFAFSVFIRRPVQSESNIEELLLLFSPLITTPLSNTEPPYLDGLAHLLNSLTVWWQTSDHSQNQEKSILAFLTPLQDTLQDFLCNNLLERCSLLPSLLRLLQACLRFRHIHPSSMDETISSYILASLSILQSPQKTSKICEDSLTELMSILVDTLELAPDDSDLAARMISLHYLASSRYNITLDLPLQRGIKILKTQAYEQSLRIAMEMLGTESSKSLVHALTVLLVHCPESTFKIAQSTFCESLAMLNDILATTKDKIDFGLQREILHYVLRICTEKPAFLRVPEVGGILTLLASFLQPSVLTGQCTHADIFHTIVKTTTALVRNRRDLILLSLPHLAVIFCLLFGTLTKPQPNLGQKQFRSISSRLPHWIILSRPLGSPEATSLSRLLATMTTKTIVRSTRTGHASHEGGKDAQSLAKPFGKHASCVIGAYIDLLNDPLCLLDRETRIELTPGLLSLCEMIGEKGRDALMPTLDAGGKVIFKYLWSSYEKQKYVGKG